MKASRKVSMWSRCDSVNWPLRKTENRETGTRDDEGDICNAREHSDHPIGHNSEQVLRGVKCGSIWRFQLFIAWPRTLGGSIYRHKKLLQDAGTYNDADWQAEGDSFIDACHATSSIRGDKEPWITHLLGGKGTTACIHVTGAARKEARIHKDLEDAKATGRAGKRSAPAQPISGDVAFAAGPSTSTSGPRHDKTASGADEPASKRFKQGSFQVFTGRDQPFTTAETEEIQAQVLRATVSAGLPFRMWENPEVVRLVRMFRTAGPDVLPSRKVVGGRLLNEAAEKVEGTVKAVLEMKEVGLIQARIMTHLIQHGRVEVPQEG
ncbi:hypothetical protein B0H14DRAFT_3676401 [Mycena olivaceomarginata]|nr:hypothetical protein B0H14DRAFT_3676401 [Mycena olivaceomarginata]